jgi:hypothetical protein
MQWAVIGIVRVKLVQQLLQPAVGVGAKDDLMCHMLHKSGAAGCQPIKTTRSSENIVALHL